MDKQTLLTNIARSAYNIGFGGKKHFITYDIYRIAPRLISVLTTIVGVYQLSTWYEKINDLQAKDLVSITLIAFGIIGLVLDLLSDNKDKYEQAGRKLIDYYNELTAIYYAVKSQNDPIQNWQIYENRRKDIVTEASSFSISNQAILTHWFTHFGFFKTMQSDWVVKELGLTFKSKYPFVHIETFIFISLLGFIILLIVKQF